TLQYVKDDEHVFSTGQILDIPEEQVTRHDGVVESFETVKSPIFNDDGEVFLTVGVSRNIMARKARQAKIAETTRALEYNQTFLNLVIDNLPSRIFWKDVNGYYLGANEKLAKDAGFPKDEIIGKDDYQMPWTTEQAEAFRADDQYVYQSGQAKLNIIEPQRQASG
ncbi:MAG: PAS domain-containing sensor histidine kinase, partial [Sphaerospermopsis sp. SIO1G2]|nr:PAS domain-containing sensor histidine kinase [Sphaerospermopsis sp. SIO1G2]